MLRIVALLASVSLVAYSLSSVIEEARGQISIAGCRSCEDGKSKEFWTCFYIPLPDKDRPDDPCDKRACNKNKVYWAECKKTGSGETDNCEMTFEAGASLWEISIYRPKDGSDPNLTCDEKKKKIDGVPDGACVSTGMPQAKCFIDAACGDFKIPDTDRVVAVGRLKCKK